MDTQMEGRIVDQMKTLYPSTKSQRLGDYKPKVFLVANENFFEYEKKFNCEILSALGTDELGFLNTVTDTRNWNSHFSEREKPSRLKQGSMMVVYLEIVTFMIRIYLVKAIGGSVNEDAIKEFYFTVHDWIVNDIQKQQCTLKSNTYQMRKSLEKFQKAIEQYSIATDTF